ncbi:MAG: hypothetical protein A3G91_01975 [Omnitrophica WOR_2 bacterium RIFCSPLOWO2_12_FULL_50_9]|nr:MAG: hypothetical protein A3G91_01975 [Omnitrophica WOR_2 bacterium RIFCSPLOWO2_12_FULL_50_9]
MGIFVMEKNPKILIVDDDKIVRLILSETLSQGGFTNIIAATNGVEALAMIKQHNPDLVITDMMMPEMDGFQLIQEIKNDASFTNIFIIVITSREEMKELVAITGVSCFITKPFNKEKVLETVQRVLNEVKPVEAAGADTSVRETDRTDKTKYKAADVYKGDLRGKKTSSGPVPLHEKIRKILDEGK